MCIPYPSDFPVLLAPCPACFRCFSALLQLHPCSIIRPRVFKPVFSPHALTARLCLLCSCACSPVLMCPHVSSCVLMCPHVSSVFPALFWLLVCLQFFLALSFACVLLFWTSYHSSWIFSSFTFLPLCVCTWILAISQMFMIKESTLHFTGGGCG